MKINFLLASAFALTFGSVAYAVGGESASTSGKSEFATGGASTAAGAMGFSLMDMNKDGFIDTKDMKAMQAHMKMMDKNKDGKVSKNEYSSFATGNM